MGTRANTNQRGFRIPRGDPRDRQAKRARLFGMTDRRDQSLHPAWRGRLHEVIFEADTAAGRAFDVLLLWCIVISVLAVLLESVATVHERYGRFLRATEWAFTILFTVEYVLRLVSVGRPLRYAISFFGLVDLLAIVPTYLSVLLPGAQTLLVIRALRLLRVFRVLKLARFLEEARVLGPTRCPGRAFRRPHRK